MYRYTKVEVGAASDSTLRYPVFGPLQLFFDQVKDLQSFDTMVRVAPGAAESQLTLGPITTAYLLLVTSDYPVMVRPNGVSATQYTLKSNSVAAPNVGSPLPNQCVFLISGTITSLYLAPIAGAVQTANVTVFAAGDPLNSYT